VSQSHLQTPKQQYEYIVSLLQERYGTNVVHSVIIPALLNLWNRFTARLYDASNPLPFASATPNTKPPIAFECYLGKLFDRATRTQDIHGSGGDGDHPDIDQLFSVLTNVAMDSFLEDQGLVQTRGRLVPSARSGKRAL
jgi:hypothetical protein